MKSLLLKIGLICVLFFYGSAANAQKTMLDMENLSEVNIDQVADAEIMAFRSKMIAMKIDDEKAYEILGSKGLSELQLEKLKERIQKLPNGQNNSTITKKSEKDRQYEAGKNETAMYDADKDLSIYGSELFLKSSLVFEPNIRIATPSSYILGPDDELIVNVYGYSEMKYEMTVNEEGEIYIPNVGPIFVGGLSIEQATSKITTKLSSTIYRAIKSGQTKVQVRLGKIRSIQVTVIGEAYRPGTYTVSSLTTLYNLLYLCGGPSNLGSYRQIEIVRGNQLYKTADLYEFLTKGDQKDNIILREGDLVRIPYYKNRVSITGSVKRIGKYEMKSGEQVADLMTYCGGFNEMAYYGAISVTRMTEKEKKVYDIKFAEFDTFNVALGDEFYVNRLQNVFINKVSLTGSVFRPGNYEVDSTLTLYEVINKSGGLLEDAFMERVNVFRIEKGKQQTIVSINLDSVMNYGVNLKLKKGDSVHVYSMTEFKDKEYVTIFGNVRKPGRISWRSKMTIKELLLEVGGINDFGDSTTIEISRRKKAISYTNAAYPETETFFINVSKQAKMGEEIELQPFDIINIKIIPGVINQRTVILFGEVLTPGKYNLQNSNDKITDLIKRAGGFKNTADSTSLIIRRKKNSALTVEEKEMLYQRLLNMDHDSITANQQIRNEIYGDYDLINVDLGAVLKNKMKLDNLTLEDGDILTVYKKSNLIKVSGEVFYPAIISLKKNKSAKYYIKQAGGFMNTARKVKTLVIYPNGKVKPVRSFFGIKKYPRITQRAEIFVPQKDKDNKTKIGLPELALIVSALGILANVILKF